MLKVIGFKEVAGDYNGNTYHNMNLHCTCPAVDTGSYGELCEVVKVKFDSIAAIFGHEMSADDWTGLVGQFIDVGYDKYGRVNYVRVATPMK